MSKTEIESRIEILRLVSLCRYAASELRALDDIIMQRHPTASGLPEALVDCLEGKSDLGFIEKYKDLASAKEDLVSLLKDSSEDLETFRDLEIEIG